MPVGPIIFIIFVKGKVEDTIPQIGSIDALALMRLDPDCYDSRASAWSICFPASSRAAS